MPVYDWNEEICHRYADSLRPMVRFDHYRWAKQIAKNLAASPANAMVVDIATGPGFLLVELGKLIPELTLVAQDQAEPMLAIAREEAKQAGLSIRTVCCPAEYLSLNDGSADVVTCKQLLHEAADVDRVIAEAARILKPGGRLFLIDFDANGSWLAATAVRTLLATTRSRQTANDFWRSFRAGLPGGVVRDLVVKAGFAESEYRRSGFNYFIIGRK